MISRRLTTVALSAGCIVALGAIPAAQAQTYPQQAYNAASAQLVTNGPQTNAGDRSDWLAREDVIKSRRYDRLLETNLAFRRFRERMECGPVSLPTLRADCFASFRQYEPFRRPGRVSRATG
jgi:hypothetical protein